VLAPLHHPSQEFKHLLYDPLFLVKVKSYNNSSAFMYMCASITENVWTDEQVAKPSEGMYMPIFKE
jgi:hypothetical protein